MLIQNFIHNFCVRLNFIRQLKYINFQPTMNDDDLPLRPIVSNREIATSDCKVFSKSNFANRYDRITISNTTNICKTEQERKSSSWI